MKDAKPSFSPRKLLRFKGRVLLVEFVNADQFPGRIAYLYPLVSGYFTRRGCPVQWIRYGISTTNLMENDRDEITLNDEEMEHLLRRVSEHLPGLLMITDHLHRPQLEAIRAAAPGVRILVTNGDLESDPLVVARSRLEVQSGIETRYDWEPGNEAARQREIDNVYLLFAKGCGHRVSISDNPRFAEVRQDPRVARKSGCAFCVSSRGDHGRLDRPSLYLRSLSGWVRLQIECLARTRPDRERLPNSILFEALPSRAILRTSLDALRELGLDDEIKLLMACRTNRVPDLDEIVREHFDAYPDSKIRFGVYASGIESFAREDLELYNKGTTPLDGVRAVNLVRELSHRYPGHFWYTGLSFLLFTPWTSLAGLHLTVRLMRLLRIGRKEAGNTFQSRLRLHEDVALEALAEHEGLVDTQVDDSLVVMNRRKLFTEEAPWRFAEPRLEPVSRVILRFDLIGSDLADELTDGVERRLKEGWPDWNPGDDLALFDYLLALLEVAGEEAEPLEVEALQDRALARWLARSKSSPPTGMRRFGFDHLSAGELEDRLATLPSDLPECCAAQAGGEVDGWSLLGSTVELLQAWVPALAFRPCAPDCEAAARTAHDRLEALGLGLPAGEEIVLLHELGAPDDGSLTELRGIRRDARGFDYDPARVRSSDSHLEARLRDGDRLEVEVGQLRILRKGELVDWLTASHVPLHPSQRWEAEGWEEIARGVALLERFTGDEEEEDIYWPPFYEKQVEVPQPIIEENEVEPPPPPREQRAYALMQQARAAEVGHLGDLVVDHVWREESGDLALRVEIEGAFYTVHLQDLRHSQGHLVATPHFGIIQPRTKDEPLRSQSSRELIRILVEAFEGLAREGASDLLPTESRG